GLAPRESAAGHGARPAQYAHVIANDYRDEYEPLFGAPPALSDVPLRAGPVDDSAAAAAWRTLTHEQRENVTRVFVNIGKSIAAYERRIQFGESRFDRYVAALVETGEAPEQVLTEDEIAGLRLFIGKAN